MRGAAERAARGGRGLTLVRASDNATSFQGVKHEQGKPFQALVCGNEKMQHLGRHLQSQQELAATSLCPECREPFSQREMRLRLR